MTQEDSMNHVSKVRAYVALMAQLLDQRALEHDASKFVEPEASGYERLHEELTPIAYGTSEYRKKMAEFDWLLYHHYAANDHHPEHSPLGVAGMSLLSLLEMMADWKAASERPQSRSPFSLEWNIERFAIEPQLASVLRNTARELGWIK